MISLSRLPSLVGIVALVCSILYLFQHGTLVDGNLRSAETWHNIARAGPGHPHSPKVHQHPTVPATLSPPHVAQFKYNHSKPEDAHSAHGADHHQVEELRDVHHHGII